MFICPHCGGRLARQQNQFGLFWGCNVCGGRTASIVVLRKVLEPDCINEIWRAARTGIGMASRHCPTCDHKMVEVPISTKTQIWKLDVCKVCQFIWFDPNEYEAIPAIPLKPIQPKNAELSQAAREALAIYETQQIAERAREANPSPDEDWKTLPALFGFPVEKHTAPLKSWPWLTWSMAALIAMVSIWSFTDLKNVIERFALIPAEADRYGGMTLLTSFFLHGGVVHLIGNLYFLLIFGDNVEDYLGRWRWLLLLLVATLAGDMVHILAEPQSMRPCVGASGGISGLIAFYALKFPHARLGFLFRIYFRFQWFHLPAWGAFGFWILLQFWGAYKQIAGFSNVSACAHLGGAAAGFIMWLWWRNLGEPTSKTELSISPKLL